MLVDRSLLVVVSPIADGDHSRRGLNYSILVYVESRRNARRARGKKGKRVNGRELNAHTHTHRDEYIRTRTREYENKSS